MNRIFSFVCRDKVFCVWFLIAFNFYCSSCSVFTVIIILLFYVLVACCASLKKSLSCIMLPINIVPLCHSFFFCCVSLVISLFFSVDKCAKFSAKSFVNFYIVFAATAARTSAIIGESDDEQKNKSFSMHITFMHT